MATSALSADQSASETSLLRASVRRMLSAHWKVNEAGEGPGDAIWKEFSRQGLAALGQSAGLSDLPQLMVVMYEMGRVGCDAPLPGTVLANLIWGEDSPGSEKTIAFSFGSFDGDRCAGSVKFAGERITGDVRFVENAGTASFLLLWCEDGRAVLLDRNDPNVTVAATPGLVRPPLWDVSIADAAPFTVSHSIPAARTDQLRVVAQLCLTARAIGAADRGFELVCEYAKLRKQFGQPIGKFQALQHKLANSAISLDGANLLLEAAASAGARGAEAAAYLAGTAIVFCAQTLRQVALETHHCFGAIGYAEEHEAPLLFRRIHGDLTRLGGLMRAREDLAALLLDTKEDLLARVDRQSEDPASALRMELQEWLTENWTDEDRRREKERAPADRKWDVAFAERLGASGWTKLNWPRSAGGQERSSIEQFAYIEELAKAGVSDIPIAGSCRILAPEIITFGSQALKDALLPDLEAGTVSLCLGYSEPEAGSDLASLRTRAQRHGDHYIVNGQKIWTTDGHRATHMLLAARTDWTEGVKHGGITLFVLPMNSPGISVRKMMAMYGSHFCSIFLDDVRIPESMRLGPENGGWQILGNALASERIMIGGFGAQVRKLFQGIIRHAKDEGMSGDAVVRDRIAHIAAEVEVSRQLTLRSILLSDGDRVPIAEAAMAKIYASELSQRVTEAAIDLLGASGLLDEQVDGAPAEGLIDQLLRQSIMMVVGGGTNEIQRDIVARRGLGLPAR